ncbi:hypothetical protein [Rubripirellula obstinata]|nr:hypothetical protein [Rubripirellula obstinata]
MDRRNIRAVGDGRSVLKYLAPYVHRGRDQRQPDSFRSMRKP